MRKRLLPAIIVAAAAVLCWFTVSFTLGMVLARRSPEEALRWWGVGARANAEAAGELITKQRSPRARQRAAGLAQAALQREPVNVAAARVLAIVAGLSRDGTSAGRYLTYAESLSRRDLLTQIILLENEVRRNNVPGALRHYDRALRVSTDGRATLLPVLIGAAADPSIAAEIAKLLRPRPPWWFAFGERLAQESRSPAAITLLLGRLNLNAADERERSLLVIAVRRLVEMRAYGHADRLYRRAGGASPAPTGNQVRNGDFEATEIGLPPFDWSLVNETQLGAYRERSDAGGGNVLRLNAGNGRGGAVARQLLLLAPGRYRLGARTGDTRSGSPPRVAILCAGRDGPSLAALDFPASGSSGARLTASFVVPRDDCVGQWLSINAASEADEAQLRPWIDFISIVRD